MKDRLLQKWLGWPDFIIRVTLIRVNPDDYRAR
jgi:hypothetical protein